MLLLPAPLFAQSGITDEDFIDALESTRVSTSSNALDATGQPTAQADDDFTYAFESTRTNTRDTSQSTTNGDDNGPSCIESQCTIDNGPSETPSSGSGDLTVPPVPPKDSSHSSQDPQPTLPPLPPIGSKDWLDIESGRYIPKDSCVNGCFKNQEEGGPRNLSPSEIEDIILAHDKPIEWIAKHKQDSNGNPLMSLLYLICKATKNPEVQASTENCEAYAKELKWFRTIGYLFDKPDPKCHELEHEPLTQSLNQPASCDGDDSNGVDSNGVDSNGVDSNDPCHGRVSVDGPCVVCPDHTLVWGADACGLPSCYSLSGEKDEGRRCLMG